MFLPLGTCVIPDLYIDLFPSKMTLNHQNNKINGYLGQNYMSITLVTTFMILLIEIWQHSSYMNYVYLGSWLSFM